MQITTGYKLYGCPIILGSLITWFDIIPNNFDIIVSVWATLFVPESCKRHLFIYLINNFTISSSLSCKFITIRQKLISTITLQEIRHDHSTFKSVLQFRFWSEFCCSLSPKGCVLPPVTCSLSHPY